MSDQILAVVAGTVLGGGFSGAVVQIWSARKKVPAERDSVVATGAEAAVASLVKSLDAETARADRAEAENGRLRQQIAALEAKLEVAQGALDEAHEQLRQIREDLATNP